MTTKPSLKAAKKAATKPSKAVYVATAADIELAAQAGAAAHMTQKYNEVFNQAAKQLKEKKAVIGDSRTCPLAKAFLAARFTGKAAVSTKKNALSAFLKAVETGKDYTERYP